MHSPDIAALQLWAASKAVVRRVWIFGSRARGTHRPDSDLDVAIEHDALPGDSSPFTTWICEAEKWRAELAAHMSVPLDLQSYVHGQTPVIQAGLDSGSQLIYERADARSS